MHGSGPTAAQGAQIGARHVALGSVPAGPSRREAGHDRPARRLGLVLGDHRRQDRCCARSSARWTASRSAFWSGQSLEELYRSLSAKRTPSGWPRSSSRRCASGSAPSRRGARSPARPAERIDKVMDVTIQREMARLESRLLFLATVGATAPFIGLFGTVWGIMTAFEAISGVGERPTSRSWRRASPRRCSPPRSASSPRCRR